MKSLIFISVAFFSFACSPKKSQNNKSEGAKRTSTDPKNADFTPANNTNGNNNNNSNGSGLENVSSSLKVESFKAEVANDIFKSLLQEIKSPSDNCQKQNYQHKKSARIITRQEYLATLKDAFDISDDEKILDRLPIETKILNFKNLRDSNVMSIEKLKGFLTASQSVIDKADNHINQAINCGSDEKTCFTRWISDILPILWRQNLTENDIRTEVGYFENLGGGVEGAKSMLQRYLISPLFLYRTHFLTKEQNSWDIATMLSDTLWHGKIDQQLIDKAKNNQLTSSNAIATEVQRLLKDQQFYQGALSWSQSWLGTDQILSKPTMTIQGANASEDQRKVLSEESGAFLYHMVQKNQDSIANLFSANFTVLPENLLQTYQFTKSSEQPAQGLPDNMSIAQFPEDRAGLLNQPSIVMNISSSSHTNIPLRGKHILGDFLCNHLETPENLLNVISSIKFDLEETTLNAVKKATSQGSCAECHSLINGPAGTLERLSPEGFARTQDDHMKDIQIGTETITTILGETHEIRNHKELSEVIGKTVDAEACITLNLFRMIYSRLETQDDVCHIADVYQSARTNEGLKIQNLYQSFLSHPSFLAQ